VSLYYQKIKKRGILLKKIITIMALFSLVIFLIPKVNYAKNDSREVEVSPGVYQIEASQDEIKSYYEKTGEMLPEIIDTSSVGKD